MPGENGERTAMARTFSSGSITVQSVTSTMSTARARRKARSSTSSASQAPMSAPATAGTVALRAHGQSSTR